MKHVKSVIVIILLILNIYNFYAQKNMDTIQLTSGLTLYQKKVANDKQLTWELFLSDRGTDIKLEKLQIPKHPMIERDFFLYIPELIDAFEHKGKIYVFAYQGGTLHFIIYTFTEETKFTKIAYEVNELSPGSIDNFGGYIFDIRKVQIEDDFYFYIESGREVGYSSKMILHLNTNNSQISKIHPDENVKYIDDEEKIFFSLTLNSGHKDEIEKYLKKALKEAGSSPADIENLVYYNCLDITPFESEKLRYRGTMYFFYKVSLNSKMGILQYDCLNNQWLVNGYSEEKIEMDNYYVINN